MAVVGWFLTAAIAYGIALLLHWDQLTEGPRPLIIFITGIGYWLLVGLVWVILHTLTWRWKPRVGDLGTCAECDHPWRDHTGSRPKRDLDGYCRQCVIDRAHGLRSATEPLCRETFIGLPL